MTINVFNKHVKAITKQIFQQSGSDVQCCYCDLLWHLISWQICTFWHFDQTKTSWFVYTTHNFYTSHLYILKLSIPFYSQLVYTEKTDIHILLFIDLFIMCMYSFCTHYVMLVLMRDCSSCWWLFSLFLLCTVLPTHIHAIRLSYYVVIKRFCVIVY